MSVGNAPIGRPSKKLRAEAAAWVARLHGPNRTPAVEAGLRRWMAESPEHAATFELLTDTWEKSARLRRRPIEQVASWQVPGFRVSFSHAAVAAVAVAIVAVVGTVLYLHNDAVVTAVGEQRTMTLQDGTRIQLNTDTRLVVHYDKRLRRVNLEKGEALFEVAKRPEWPFVVTAGNEQIRALGTEFIVRRDEQNVAVTLVEGKVTVSPVAASTPLMRGAPGPSTSLQGGTGAPPIPDVVTLSPGQRLKVASSRQPTLDRPPLDRLTAWERGQVSLDNTPLAEAVAELNRYSKIHLILGAGDSEGIRVSGVFRAGDSENFAQAVARTYRLQVRNEGDNIVLSSPVQ